MRHLHDSFERMDAAHEESTRRIEAALQRNTQTILESLQSGGLETFDFQWSSDDEDSVACSPKSRVSARITAASLSKSKASQSSSAASRLAGGPGHASYVLPASASSLDEEEGKTSDGCDNNKERNRQNSSSSAGSIQVVNWHTSVGRAMRAGSATISSMVGRRLEAWQRYLDQLQRPEGHNACTKFFWSRLHKAFDMLCMAVTLLDIILMVQMVNCDISEPGTWEETIAVAWIFTAFYITELLVRIYMEGWYFVFGKGKFWNFLDIILVLASILSNHGVAAWRVAKVLRTAKLLRFYRYTKSETLEVMIACMFGSISMLLWCVLMIGFFTFLFSVFFSHLLAEKLKDGSIEKSSLDAFREFFGSVQDGMMTLLMITTGGSEWNEVYAAISVVGVVAKALLVIYILFFTIAVWNVVVSTFVDRALKLAKVSDETVITVAKSKATRDARELRNFFRKVDQNCDGCLDFAEFTECVQTSGFERWLQSRGIDIKETRTFFKMIGHGQRSVDIDSLVRACMRMRGFATSVDLHTMRYELQRIQRMIRAAQQASTAEVE